MKSKSASVSEIIDNIRRIYHVLTEQSKGIEHETGLTGPQLWVVKMLNDTSPMKVSDLAHRMYLHPATMVGLLDRLEAKGLVQRKRSESDRRVVYIDLTEEGHGLVENSPEVTQSLLVNGLEELAENKLDAISGAFDQVVKILDCHDAPAKLIVSSEINSQKRKMSQRVAGIDCRP